MIKKGIFHNKDNSDRIYYNFIIGERVNNKPFYEAKFQQNLDDVFLKTPSEYYLSVVRFSIPCQNIPIWYPEIKLYPNTNINDTVYSVSLEYNGFTSGETFVQFVSENPNAYVRSITVNNPEAETSSIYYWIYNYQAVVDMINTALATAFTALGVASGGLPVGSVAPYFEFDPVTQLMSLVAQRLFYDVGIALPITVFMNYKLYTYFDSMLSNYLGTNSYNVYLPNGKDFQIIVKDLKNNWYNPSFVVAASPPNYYKMSQNYPTLLNWGVFQSLQITTNLIPVKSEVAPTLDSNDSSNTTEQSFLKDFEPVLNNGGDTRNGVLQYVLDGPYQLINLVGNTPLKKLDIQLYWVDRLGRKYLLLCPYNQVVSIKTVFIKKSSYKEDE